VTWSPSGDSTTILSYTSTEGSYTYKGHTFFELVRLNVRIPDGQTGARFSWGVLNAGNNWWWSIDNPAVLGTVDVDECALMKERGMDSSCTNGGVCADSDEPGAYKCDCTDTGHVGDLCEADIDECKADASLCKNGAKCENTKGGYSCACTYAANGWKGTHCDVDEDECELLGLDACANGGQCTNTEGAYECDCAGTGYTGYTCTQNVNECQVPGACARGECTDSTPGFSCDCTDSGYDIVPLPLCQQCGALCLLPSVRICVLLGMFGRTVANA
jgi:hypothetical protein